MLVSHNVLLSGLIINVVLLTFLINLDFFLAGLGVVNELIGATGLLFLVDVMTIVLLRSRGDRPVTTG